MSAVGNFFKGIAGGLLGGIAGGSNPRPPSLDKVQRGALDSIIPFLQKGATTQPGIDPTQQSLLYGNIAQGQTGANNAVTHALVSRGLGQSGILGDALTQVANQAQTNRNTADLSLQQQGIQRQQFDIQALLSSLGVSNIPGQSGFGATMAGLAPVLAYSIQNAMNNKGAGIGVPNNLPFSLPSNFPLPPGPFSNPPPIPLR